MFGIKTKIIKRIEDRLTLQGQLLSKPGFLESKLLHILIKKKLQEELKFVNLQSPIAKKSNPFAATLIKNTSAFMPNNLGNWSIKQPHTVTAKVELELIRWLKKNYHASANIAGHFSSGSTEGNIYAAWLGRNYLQKKLKFNDTNKIALLKSSLAHYSLDKAADLIGVRLFEAAINEESFSLDLPSLKSQLEKLYQAGKRGFLLPLTLGYTVTGTDDDYLKVSELATEFELNHSGSACFLWLDAAFSGLSKIYTEKNFRPFQANNIQLISADFHKFLAVPYPASFLLYRQSLLKYIQKPIPYIDQLDTTLLGSRPGIGVLASWITLLKLEEQEIKQKIDKALKIKGDFLQSVKLKNEKIRIINNKNSLQACLVLRNKKTPISIEQNNHLIITKYSLLTAGRKKTFYIAKLYFLNFLF